LQLRRNQKHKLHIELEHASQNLYAVTYVDSTKQGWHGTSSFDHIKQLLPSMPVAGNMINQ
jgi:hypothetical protein